MPKMNFIRLIWLDASEEFYVNNPTNAAAEDLLMLVHVLTKN
jgi:hypothetical protein